MVCVWCDVCELCVWKVDCMCGKSVLAYVCICTHCSLVCGVVCGVCAMCVMC